MRGYPPPAQVMGVLMNAIFLDCIDYDAFNMGRINELARGACRRSSAAACASVELLILRPSATSASWPPSTSRACRSPSAS